MWNLKGGVLSYANLEIENPSDIIEFYDEKKEVVENPLYKSVNHSKHVEEDSDEENSKNALKVTFLSLIFVNETIITAGNDGFLYVWDNMKVVKK